MGTHITNGEAIDMGANNTTSSHLTEGLEVLSRLSARESFAVLYRLLNQSAALVLLVLFSPVLLVVALLIRRADGAPVLFGHYRVGRQGRMFKCWKFRTMVVNSQEILTHLLATSAQAREEWERDQKLSHDPRITRVGAFLRKTSLDELPQLFNVLRGEMYLVGPRPITLAELERYGKSRWHYLHATPGMTGLWQVSGRSETTYEERVALDRQYVEARTLWTDLGILLKTVGVVLGKHGAR
jgi:exopolysaccharide production protein ExoY